MEISKVPVVRAEMLIRRPAAAVFEAIVDPAITTKFWLREAADRLSLARRSAGTGRCTASQLTSS